MAEIENESGSVREDLMMLTKARLSLMVVVTTFFGFWLASVGGSFDGWLFFHTVLGTSLAALASSVFNQLMEIDVDAKMDRTKGRPLPARRMPPGAAFILGWVLAAFAIVHLAKKVNIEASALTALTLFIYIFVYTPLKQRSSTNTLVGAVAGAIPPVIGWAGAAGAAAEAVSFRWGLLIEPGALFLFGLLFFWQLPHFLAINWIYRQQYIDGGFVMWSNDDESGAKTGVLSVLFSICLLLTMAIPVIAGNAGVAFAVISGVLSLVMVVLAFRFFQVRDRGAARKLFFFTLIYLPLLLGVSLIFWRA